MTNNKGITIITLIISIIIILIIAGILLVKGIKLIKDSQIENLMTNMITIRAKAKVYSEEINSEIWEEQDKEAKKKELYLQKYNMTTYNNIEELLSKIRNEINTESEFECYEITKQTLETMGLTQLAEEANNGDYIILYSLDDTNNIEVIYTPAIEYNKNKYYTLTKIQTDLAK